MGDCVGNCPRRSPNPSLLRVLRPLLPPRHLGLLGQLLGPQHGPGRHGGLGLTVASLCAYHHGRSSMLGGAAAAIAAAAATRSAAPMQRRKDAKQALTTPRTGFGRRLQPTYWPWVRSSVQTSTVSGVAPHRTSTPVHRVRYGEHSTACSSWEKVSGLGPPSHTGVAQGQQRGRRARVTGWSAAAVKAGKGAHAAERC